MNTAYNIIDHHYDVIVIGAGPSGVSSAIKCSEKGLKVLIVDSNQNCGGQIYRAPPKSYKKLLWNFHDENQFQKKYGFSKLAEGLHFQYLYMKAVPKRSLLLGILALKS